MKGTISVGRYTNYRNEDDLSVHIQIEDEISGTRFLDLHMTPRDFAQAVLGQGYVDCEFELNTKHVGKIRERKSESIYLPHKVRTDEERKRLLSYYELDGWVAYAPDLGNHHRCTMSDASGSHYDVSFTRFVDAPVEA